MSFLDRLHMRRSSTLEVRYNGKVILRSDHAKLLCTLAETVITIPAKPDIFTGTLLEDKADDNWLAKAYSEIEDGADTKIAKSSTKYSKKRKSNKLSKSQSPSSTLTPLHEAMAINLPEAFPYEKVKSEPKPKRATKKRTS